jgi:hypothetical protein
VARSDNVVWVQLATRIPKTLHRRLKLHCVTADTSVMGFVVQAIEEKLARVGDEIVAVPSLRILPGTQIKHRGDRGGSSFRTTSRSISGSPELATGRRALEHRE